MPTLDRVTIRWLFMVVNAFVGVVFDEAKEDDELDGDEITLFWIEVIGEGGSSILVGSGWYVHSGVFERENG